MTAELVFSNVVAYSLQILWVVALAAALQRVLRLADPGSRLLVWRLVLAAVLLLPVVAPYRPQAVPLAVAAPSTGVTVTVSTQIQQAVDVDRSSVSAAAVILGLLACGMGVRLAWLGLGLFRLRLYRLRSEPLEACAGEGIDVRVSRELRSPVTFGFRRPVILLPTEIADDPEARRLAIAHEAIHAGRRHWPQVVVEEVVRALFWFHPAVHWLLRELRLAREEQVDSLTADSLGSRSQYLKALLAVAGKTVRLPAPSLDGDLQSRVRALVRTTPLGRKRARWTTGIVCATLALGLLVVAARIPLTGPTRQGIAPQQEPVQLTRLPLPVYRPAPEYPAAAREAGTSGGVAIRIVVNEAGEVWSTSVESGPDVLREAALRAVLGWRYAPFLQNDQPVPWTGVVRVWFRELTATADTGEKVLVLQVDKAGNAWNRGSVLEGARLEDEISRADGVRVLHDSDTSVPFSDVRSVLEKAGAAFVSFEETATPEVYQLPVHAAAGGPQLPYRNPILVHRTTPRYTTEALEARVSGVVLLKAILDEEGRVSEVEVLRDLGYGLADRAMQTIQQDWIFEPALLGARPIAVEATVEVTFTHRKPEDDQ